MKWSATIRSLEVGILLGLLWGLAGTVLLVWFGANLGIFPIVLSGGFELALGAVAGAAGAVCLVLWGRLGNTMPGDSVVALTAAGLFLIHAWLVEAVQVPLVGFGPQVVAGLAAIVPAAGVWYLWRRRERAGSLSSWRSIIVHGAVMVGMVTAWRWLHSPVGNAAAIQMRGGGGYFSHVEASGGLGTGTRVLLDLAALAGGGLLWWAAGKWAGKRGSSPGLRSRSWVRATSGTFAVGFGLVVGLSEFVRTEHPREEASPAAIGATDDGRGSVLLIVCDTLRRDRLSCYGYPRPVSKRIDEFAADSTVYEHCTSPSSWTLPSHASLFTGLYPSAHKTYLAWPMEGTDPEEAKMCVLGEEAETMAELFQDAGYRTGAIVSNWGYLSRVFGLDQGFDYYDDRSPRTIGFRPMAYLVWGFLYPRHYKVHDCPYRRAEEITSEAVKWIGHDRSRRFFLFLNYMDAHEPYFPVPPYDSMFPGRHEGIDAYRDAILGDVRDMTAEEYAGLSAAYDAEVASLDDQIGRLLDYLRREGLFETTTIVITADHGQALGEHRLVEHGYSLYEPEVAIPLIVRIPGRGPEREGKSVNLIDVFPTILKAEGIQVPPNIQARPLDSKPRPVVAELWPDERTVALYGKRFDRTLQAVSANGTKCILSSAGPPEVYDVIKDPGESRNIAEKRPEVVRAAEAVAREVIEDTTAALPSSGGLKVDARLRDALKRLGYMGGGG